MVALRQLLVLSGGFASLNAASASLATSWDNHSLLNVRVDNTTSAGSFGSAVGSASSAGSVAGSAAGSAGSPGSGSHNYSWSAADSSGSSSVPSHGSGSGASTSSSASSHSSSFGGSKSGSESDSSGLPAPVTSTGESCNATYLTYHTWKQYDSKSYLWHTNLSMLWVTQWKIFSQQGIYPFDSWSNGTDFQRVFNSLLAKHRGQSGNGFDQDTWATPFLDQGKKIMAMAQDHVKQGNLTAAAATYFRAATVFRLGYFPWVGRSSKSAKKKAAYELEKQSYELGVQYYTPYVAFTKVEIPYTNAPKNASNNTIYGYMHSNRNWTAKSHVRRTAPVRPEKQKLVLIISGLDHYRPGQWRNVQALLAANFTTLVVDMPGTGDAPIDGRLPQQDTSMWKTVLDWVEDHADTYAIDANNMHAWGVSTGSYYSIKVGRSERLRLKSVLSQGQASHYAFEPDWLKSADYLSYPVDLWGPLASAFGYSYDTKHVFAQVSRNYSLLAQGVMDSPSAHVTIANGVDDTVFPIDDATILTAYGSGAYLRLFPDQGHMGGAAGNLWADEYWKQVQAKGYL